MSEQNRDKTLAIVSGVMAGAINEAMVVEFCRRNLAETRKFLSDCAMALVSAKCVEHDEHFHEEAGPLLSGVQAVPVFKVLAGRLIKADIDTDDELRSAVSRSVWERRVAWLQQQVESA